MNIYELTHRTPCPNGGLMDAYAIKIESEQTIMVEDILKAMKEAPSPTFQEALADWLRNQLGARITITGIHYGIKITCLRY